MSRPAPLPRLRDPQADTMSTTCFISNLHCPSCVDGIKASLSALEPPPQDVFVSIVSHSVVIRHATSLNLDDITGSLEAAGFEIHSTFQNNKAVSYPIEVRDSYTEGNSKEWHTSLERAVSYWLHPQRPNGSSDEMRKKEAHLAQCEQCKREQGGVSLDSADALPAKPHPVITTSPKASMDDSVSPKPRSPFSEKFIAIEAPNTTKTYKATLALTGMTCSSCVSAITHAVQEHPWVQSVDVNLLTNSGVVIFSGKDKCNELVETIEDCGFDVAVEKLEEVRNTASETSPTNQKTERWRATYSVGGLTCSSCVGNVTRALEQHMWIETIDVNLISNSATIVFVGKEHLPEIKETIEDVGYTASLESIVPEGSTTIEAFERTVAIRVDGMFCAHCPQKIIRGLQDAFDNRDNFALEDPSISLAQPVLHVKYVPDPPNFTIRHVFSTISSLNPVFKPSVFHPPTIEERARQMHAQERTRILFRLLLCIVIAIPTFILGIVFMSLVSSNNPTRKYLMGKMWAGNVTRLSWALFILATPVYFFAADTFHRRAIKEVKSMWRLGSRTSYLHRFTRFGSMNMLISLGTTIAYLASIAELVLAATKTSAGSMHDSYFDAVVFLTMFLLIGRFLEAYSKAKTGDAVTSLGKLRPNEAILVDSENGDVKIATDLLEIGDVVRVNHGTSPPFDGEIIDGSSNFDESSLTGESRPVKKSEGDTVYSGTMNKGAPVKIRITTISGTSMLDQIINAVREGQSRRAPVERAADVITSHFVPFVIVIAIITWLVWLILGTTGGIPSDWKSDAAGSWELWSLRFAIAVFVIACPCGIGLAAPTALFVGGGLAAKHGILVRGGGEAFQEASSLDCIVFDKTGTLTQGGDPAVTSHKFSGDRHDSLVVGIVKALEENSNHPIARALVSFCNKEKYITPTVVNVDEVPGKGLKGTLRFEGQEVTAIVGNESFMADYHIPIPAEDAVLLEKWKTQGESIALVALFMPQRTRESSQPSQLFDATESLSTAITETTPPSTWRLAGSFSIADAVRPEAPSVIKALHKRGIDVWMLSGDNPTTANAVGAQVGIPSSNIIAGVLPDQKAEKIKYLQKTLSKPQKTFFRIPFFGNSKPTSKRATVAMVGDGINDAPALSTADLSIAIGSGSDIALSSSSFILINSRLTTILTLLDLSRVVFRRVYFNFGWALVYNLIAMPIAAGVLFPVTTGGAGKPMEMHHEGVGMKGGMAMEQTGKTHVRLDPVWASLAMALSSVSVVCSSLSLRSKLPGVGFRVKREDNECK